MLERIENCGPLIDECRLPGETRADDVIPGHVNAIRVSRDRWLVLNATRGFRVVDDDRSIVYQLRSDVPDGRVLKEGFLSPSVWDWQPLGGLEPCFKQHGHPVGFGVPKGALINGRPAPHANVFVVKWRVLGMKPIPDGRGGRTVTHDKDLSAATQGVEWMQLRLNDAEDDIEVIRPVAPMRQKGYESGPAWCSLTPLLPMNQAFVQPVPFKGDCTEWADCNHFSGRIAPLKYRFNPALGAYEWVETGPYWESPEGSLSEASLARLGDDWFVAARLSGTKISGRTAWARTRDLFSPLPAPALVPGRGCTVPLCVYACADGVLRLFSNSTVDSPYTQIRNPLYCWDINPADFSMSNVRVVFDAAKAGLVQRPDVEMMVDFGQLIPTGEKTDYLVHRKLVAACDVVNRWWTVPALPQEKAVSGVHYVRLTYDHARPAPWTFASGNMGT